MGIIALFILLIIAGFIINKIFYTELLGSTIQVIGIFGVACCIIALLLMYVCANADVATYNADKVKFETAINNSNLTGVERASVIDMATKDNSIIKMAIIYHNSILFNVFVPSVYINMQPFDLNKIPKAVNSISIQK